MINSNNDIHENQRELLDEMLKNTFTPQVKAEYLRTILDNDDVSFELYRLNEYKPISTNLLGTRVSHVIEVMAVNTEGGTDDPVYLQFQNKRCRDWDDSCTRFVLPAAWPIEKIIDELIHTDLLVSTCDSSDADSLHLLEAVRDTIARTSWRAGCNGLTNASLADWVFDFIDAYDSDKEDFLHHQPKPYELAVALLFDEPMLGDHENPSNVGRMSDDVTLHVTRDLTKAFGKPVKVKHDDEVQVNESGELAVTRESGDH